MDRFYGRTSSIVPEKADTVDEAFASKRTELFLGFR